MSTEKIDSVWKNSNIRDLTTFSPGDPNENPWVLGEPKAENIEIEPYDARWAIQFKALKGSIDDALGEKALAVEHVGSTAVPGLFAKPVIDIDVIVSAPEDENAYVPSLTELGYTLIIREKSWYQHRMLRHESICMSLGRTVRSIFAIYYFVIGFLLIPRTVAYTLMQRCKPHTA